MSAIAANQPTNRYQHRHRHRHRHRLCLIVFVLLWLDAWAALASHSDGSAVHIELRRRRSVRLNGIELDENALLEQLAGHERALIFGTAAAPEFKFVQLERRSWQQQQQQHQQQHQHTRRRRSASQAGEHVEAELRLLRQAPQLFDDNFIFIRRNANSTQFVEHSTQLLQRLERCFYRSPSAALDLCDEQSARGVFQQNSSNFVIQPLPARFGPAAHVLYRARLDKSHDNGGSQAIPLDSQLQFEPDADEFNEPQQQQPQPQRQQLRHKLQSQLRLRYQPRHHHQQQQQQHHHHYHHHHYQAEHHRRDDDDADDDGNTRRLRRHIGDAPRRWAVPNELFIETAIFVDSDLYRHMGQNFPTNTENELMRFVLAMINGVQLLYHHSTLGKRINFVLKRLEILPQDTPGLRRSSDIDNYLHNFCLWQKSLNPVSDADSLHYDHAVILTGLDLHVTDKNGKVRSQVVGLAPVAGMCTDTSSCTINEGKHFESVFVVAHEIGHNLGMRHDSTENYCDPSLHIMSPTLGSGKITWSKCSRMYLEDFLSQPQAECLFDRGHFIGPLDHWAEDKLPGERFDANQQCMLKFGRNSVHASSQNKPDICRDLHCQCERLTWTSHPALEGTECGQNMWCRGGSCKMRPTKPTKPPNPGQSKASLSKPSYEKHSAIYAESSRMEQLQLEYKGSGNELPDLSTWSDWGEPSGCDSSCLYGPSNRLREGSTGLRVYSRSCLNYPKRCSGRDRKFETCIAKQCYDVPVQTIADFATNVCKQARKSDSELTGEGQQLTGSIEDSCKIFCRTKSNGTKSRRWTFPDGTTCRAQEHGPGQIAYCISGRCQKFYCNNATDNFYKMDNTFCAIRTPRPRPERDSTELESKQQPNYGNRQYPDHRNRYENEVAVRSVQDHGNHLVPQPKPYKRKVYSHLPTPGASSNEYKYNYHVQDSYGKAAPPPASASLIAESELSNEWQVESGCHSNCMTESMGIQVVRSRHTGQRNIQLCTHKVKPCERLLTPTEYAEQTCARYKLKVRGLSGHGAQISASVREPDRSCRVGCQDEHINYRYYLVHGIHGHFPIGTRCSQLGRRFCVDGKCLEFGPDQLPLQQSHISLALFRNRRELAPRKKRSFLYYDPVNITETITQEFLNGIVSSIMDFERRHQDFTSGNIELSNPIHVSADELSRY